MKQFDLNLLVALDALLGTCSVTEAARRMHLSTPAMSHTLARIRDMLGDPILVRAGRKLVPTPRALELMQPISQLLAQANALVANGSVDSLMRVHRNFVVRAPEGVSVVFGAPLAQAMQELMPSATVQFVSEARGENSALRDGRIDLDIGSIRHEDPEIETELLTQQTLIGVVRTGHPLLTGKLNATRFAAGRHVGVTLRHHEVSPVDAALMQANLKRFVAMTVHSSYGALLVAARSDLVATVPEVMARTMQAVLRVEVFDLPLMVDTVPIVLAWHPRYEVDAAHMALRTCVKRVMGDQHWQNPTNDLQRRG